MQTKHQQAHKAWGVNPKLPCGGRMKTQMSPLETTQARCAETPVIQCPGSWGKRLSSLRSAWVKKQDPGSKTKPNPKYTGVAIWSVSQTAQCYIRF